MSTGSARGPASRRRCAGCGGRPSGGSLRDKPPPPLHRRCYRTAATGKFRVAVALIIARMGCFRGGAEMGDLTGIEHAAGTSCPRCGKALPPRAGFCRRCGHSLHPLGSRLTPGWILAIGAAVLGVACLAGVGLYESPGGLSYRATRVPREAPPAVTPAVTPSETPAPTSELRLPAPTRQVTPPPPPAPRHDSLRPQRSPHVAALPPPPSVSPEPVRRAPPVVQTAPPPPPRRRILPHDPWRCDTTLGGPGQRVAVTLRAPCTGILRAFELNVTEDAGSTGDLLVDVCRVDDAGLPDERAVVATVVGRHGRLPPVWTGGVRSFECNVFDHLFREGEHVALVIRSGPGGSYRLGALSGDPSDSESFVRDEGGAWSPAPGQADLHYTSSWVPDHLLGQFMDSRASLRRPRK